MEQVVCLVFAKPPRPGRTKTRLAAAIGEVPAADLARAFLRDTVDRLRELGWARVVISTPEPEVDHGVDAERWDQGTGELGARLEQGFRRGLPTPVIALGGDSPGVPPEHLEAVRAGLEAGAVLAPTDDGGFWALGLRSFPRDGMLTGLPWSTPETAAATGQRLREHGLAVVDGPRWWDVDVLADLARLRREVARTSAPATHAVLDGLGWR